MMATAPGMPVEKSAKPVIAGVLLILALIKSLIVLPAALILLSVSGSAFSSAIPGLGIFAAMGAIFAVLIIVGIVGALIGLIFCFMRKKYMLALIGCILAIVGTSLILGIIALVLVVLSKKEFAA